MSFVRSWGLRDWLASALTLGIVAGCGFPDHTFDDNKFYSKRGSSGATSSGDASMLGSGGAGGTSTSGGGANAAGGSSGAAGTGTIGKGNPDAGLGGSGGSTTPDGGVDSGVDAGPFCGPNLSLCPTALCVDFLSDNNHCGDCDTKCIGTDICKGGTCGSPCDSPLTPCKPAGSASTVCVDLTTDENNCGACNTKCAQGYSCTGSPPACVINCSPPLSLRCGASTCVDPTANATCGTCNNDCTTTGKKCSGGSCVQSCVGTETLCGGQCVDLKTDPNNCNACGHPCGAQQGCVGGVCKNLVENCTNGIDDDNDNLVDCADPDCNAGYTCAATPAGWLGPVALWTGPGGTAPACGSAGPYSQLFLDAHDGLNPPAFSCGDCDCTPTNATCNDIRSIWFDKVNTCASTQTTKTYPIDVPVSGACATAGGINPPLAGANYAEYFPTVINNVDQPPPAVGTCTAHPPPPVFPDPTWTTDVRACGGAATTAGGCGLGACLPKPTAPFGTSLCVYKEGQNGCPTGYSVKKPVEYESWTEGRTCSCSCGAMGCGGTVTVYTDTNCTVGGKIIPYDGLSCTSVGADPSTTFNGPDSRSVQWTGAGPVCGATNGTLGGAPTPSDVVTICCQN